MTSQLRHDDFDRLMAAWMERDALVSEPEALFDSVIRVTSHARRRPAWTLPERWIPMQVTARLQPVPRLAPILALVALVLLAAAIALLTVGSQPRLPPPFGAAANGLIAYDTGRTIVVAKADGTGVRTLVASVPNATSPVFSRDGARIAFWGDGSPDSLYVADSDGSHVRSLLGDLWISTDKPPSWSPDGRSIVVSTESGPNLVDERLVVIDVDTGAARTLRPQSDVRMIRPTWSPDGAWIAYVGLPTRAADPFGLWVVRPDGREARRLPTSAFGKDIGPPHWSPDPAHPQLAYSDLASPLVSAIHVFDLAANRETTISSDPAYELWPAWSSDGTRLAWLFTGGVRLAAVADPSETVDLPKSAVQQPIAWSPDDRLIYGFDTDRTTLIVLTVDGSTPAIRLPRGGASASLPDWQRVNP
jgi:Tol biopolymer transport system component